MRRRRPDDTVAGRHPEARLRIIGGTWRSRRLPFAADAGIRPTPDRVRETLFNWLRDVVPGARCLDLFAGSGALGFEALSRGAAETVMVDQDIRVVQQLQANAEALGADHLTVVWSDAWDYLCEARTPPFDVVFLDPPFRDDILGEGCRRLEHSRLLTDPAWIYLEADRRRPAPPLPDGWRFVHIKQAGNVAYRLARRGTHPP